MNMRVLFVCTGNAFRSPIAEALTRKMHGWAAESAGTSPASAVADNTRRLLEKHGADAFLKPSPDSVSQRAIDEADLVVAMEEGHREFLEQNFEVGKEVLVWGVKDPVTGEISPEEAYREIRDRVDSLLP